MLDQITLVIGSLGIFQAAFLCVYFLTLKSGRRVTHLLLALLLAGLTIRIGKSIFNHYFEIAHWHRNLGLAGFLLVGPALWLYGRALLDKQFQLNRGHLLHFLPALAYLIGSGVIPNHRDLASLVSYGLVMAQCALYLILSWRLWWVEMRSDSHVDLVGWYRSILYGISFIWLFYALIVLRFLPFYIAGALFYSGLIYFFSFLLLKHHVFTLEKYGRSRLAQPDSRELLAKTQQLFDQEHLYLESKLTLSTVAKTLGVSAHELSQAINQHRGVNFSEFVQQYRVDRAKQLLADPQQRSAKLAVIGMECGFGNTTSFNQAFKKWVGETPSEYRKSRNLP